MRGMEQISAGLGSAALLLFRLTPWMNEFRAMRALRVAQYCRLLRHCLAELLEVLWGAGAPICISGL